MILCRLLNRHSPRTGICSFHFHDPYDTGGHLVSDANKGITSIRYNTLGLPAEVTDSDGNVEQDNHYYPYGMLMGESGDILATARNGRNPLKPSDANPYLYGSKEYLTTGGANLLDFTARTYDPSTLLFHTPDPLRDKYLHVNPYLYCGADPVNRIDPTGCGDFWDGGKILGNDGRNDGKVYVMKTTNEVFEDKKLGLTSPGEGLSKDAYKETKKFIENNSGNSNAFQEGCVAYTNCVEIEGSRENRKEMVSIVSADDGKGGTKDSNNREFGGYIKDGEVVQVEPGPVCDPKSGENPEITIQSYGAPTFHSHPSRGRGPADTSPPFKGSSIGGPAGDQNRYLQFPSEDDIKQAGSTINYVFGRGDNKVYVYNSSCIIAVVSMSLFGK